MSFESGSEKREISKRAFLLVGGCLLAGLGVTCLVDAVDGVAKSHAIERRAEIASGDQADQLHQLAEGVSDTAVFDVGFGGVIGIAGLSLLKSADSYQ